MTAVVAARWDIEWERGAGWWVRLGRRTRTGDVLALAEPCGLEVRQVDAPSTAPALLAVSGVLDEAGDYFDLTVTREQVEALPLSRYEYRIPVVDAVRSLPILLLRGLVAISDNVGDR
jgi:hypothetical protein